ncbi:MAG: FAD-dependent oxidoreductase [Sutterellaceae bacterium]|nr:FAD-dependent oxidoreductase [Sutterellaceae bacterium]MDD7441264.1 FAD-dependent oxidoreductase [Sutterellaceae bacterium]MDY2867261.1 FAD-dependent oxidoreductase [Mesosutterella sp.]
MKAFVKTLSAVAMSVAMSCAWAAPKMSADVVVIGSGGAGMTASVAAAENGAKVIVLEKNAFTGGGAAFAEGIFAVESRLQRDAADAGTREESFKKDMERSFWTADPIRVRDFIWGSAENVDWLMKHGVPVFFRKESVIKEPTWHVFGHYKNTEHGAALIQCMQDNAERLGVKFYLNTPAVGLIKDSNGAVVGVKAKSQKDGEFEIAAKKVIIATGGFGDSAEKVKNWGHRDFKVWRPSVPLNKTGDGIQMAYDVGAQHGEYGFVSHVGTPASHVKFAGNLYTASWQPSALWVNSDGIRFADEGIALSFGLAGDAVYQQFGSEAWSIFDATQVKYMMEQGADSGIGVIVAPGTKLPNLQKEIDEALAKGSDGFVKASSVAELAKKIGVPEKALQKSVEDYNKACDFGADPMFFKTPRYLRKIDTKNMYAIKLNSYFFCTFGGLKTNLKHEVLDTHNKPIPNLYATGADVSGFTSVFYNPYASGHLFGYAVYSGRHAGENAAHALGLKK